MTFMVTIVLVLAAAAPPSHLTPSENAACLECHADQSPSLIGKTYAESPHGVLSCERCHEEAAGETHASNPDRPLGLPQGRAALAEYSDRCLKCHAAITTSYAKSFHGIAVNQGDLRAATCVDCHGAHDIFGVAETRSSVHPDRLPSTCGTADCHPGAPNKFADGREHIDPMQAGEGTDLWIHWAWKFFIALILFDVMKDGPIVMFELLRRIRG